MRGRITGVIILIAATIASAVAAYELGINPPIGNVAGAFASIAVLVLVSRIIKVSDTLFYSGLVFVFMASPMGSVINLYRSFDPYDKIVHLITGFLLAALGMLIMEKLMKRANRKCASFAVFAGPMIFAACMFSGAGAGLWEICRVRRRQGGRRRDAAWYGRHGHRYDSGQHRELSSTRGSRPERAL